MHVTKGTLLYAPGENRLREYLQVSKAIFLLDSHSELHQTLPLSLTFPFFFFKGWPARLELRNQS